MHHLPPTAEEFDEKSPELAASISRIEDLILSQVHSGIDSRRVFLVGFSQGAALALMTGLSSLHELGGIVSLSGWIPNRYREVISSVKFFINVAECRTVDLDGEPYSISAFVLVPR